MLQIGNAQNYKFGKVSKAELEEKYYPTDSTANAAYLYRKRKTYFNYVQGEGFHLITEVHERIKIYNKEGYKWATKEIEFYSSGDERVTIKKAKTFSLVNGKIESFKLSKKETFDEEKNEYWSKKKFTMPNVSEGCVVEWEYIIGSTYTKIDNVEIQFAIPVKKLESSIEIPEYYKYGVKQIGYLPIKVKNSVKSSTIKFQYKSRSGGSLSSGIAKTNFSSEEIRLDVHISQIEKKNVPALIEEPHINNIDNYRAAVNYELKWIKWPNQITKYFSLTWEDVAKTIYNNPEFGGELKKSRHLTDDISELKNKFTTEDDKIFGALEFVKSKIKWNDFYGKYTQKGLRKAYKEGVGNIADINLTLVVVLRELGLKANPVLVSTRSNGIPTAPTISGFNYVIAVVETNQGKVLLDASEEASLPNVLPLRALNWNGTIVRDDNSSGLVDLGSSMVAVEESFLKYKISDDGFIKGMDRVKYENLRSIEYRNKKGQLSEDDLISNIEGSNNDIEIVNFRLSNKDNLAKPIIETFTFEKEDAVEIIGNRMYLTPLLFNCLDENPFKLEKREYPVDFGTPWQNKATVALEIPGGYKVETLPENISVELRDNMGRFVYSISNVEKVVQISTLIEINKGVVPATYYTELKALFKQVVAKQTEQIVLSKI